MLNQQQHYGQSRERMAEKHLRKKGYKTIARNFRSPFGEIDIVARHKETIVFIEVKARRSHRFGVPQEAITAAKQRKISMTALAYLKKYHSVDTPARFDVVAIQETQTSPRIEVITNAFELAYS